MGVNKRITKEEREEIRARCEAATPGPWSKDSGEALKVRAPHGGYVAIMGNLIGLHGSGGREQSEIVSTNAIFIAHARTDIPRLLDALEAAEAMNGEIAMLLERVEAKLSAYAGLCRGDKELTRTILPMISSARARLAALEGGAQ